MLPWILCFLNVSSESPQSKLLPESKNNDLIWWNPKGSFPTVDSYKIFQGDILVSTSSNKNLKNAIKSKRHLWENAIIPYDFGENFTYTEKNLILEAMGILEEKSCIRFVEKNKENTYIKFQKNQNGCYAPIGRLLELDGPMPVNLQSPECFKEIGIIEHELLHVVGLFHEQSRPDRNQHVTIHWCNILPFHETDFLKGNDDLMNTFDLPYDFNSIMHYPKLAFSRNGKPTITAKMNPNMTLGQRNGPSDLDFEKINAMYQCKEKINGKEWKKPAKEK